MSTRTIFALSFLLWAKENSPIPLNLLRGSQKQSKAIAMAGSRRRTRRMRSSKVRVGVRKVANAQQRRAPLPVELKFAGGAECERRAAAGAPADGPPTPFLLAGGKLAAPAWDVTAPPARNYAAAGLAVNPNKRTGRNAPTGGTGIEVSVRAFSSFLLSRPCPWRWSASPPHYSVSPRRRPASAACPANSVAGSLVAMSFASLSLSLTTRPRRLPPPHPPGYSQSHRGRHAALHRLRRR